MPVAPGDAVKAGRKAELDEQAAKAAGFGAPKTQGSHPVEAPSGGSHSVYRSVDAAGNVQYVGITNDIARRSAEHLRTKGIEIEKLLGNLSLRDARALEQALIEVHDLGKNGGTLLNKINSISPLNPTYADQLRRGLELLQSIGY